MSLQVSLNGGMMIKSKSEQITDYFDELYPDAFCELNFSNNFELVVAVLLSAQTTDKSVNKLTESLFLKYQTIDSYADAKITVLENDLRTIGLYRNKAKSVKQLAITIRDDFNYNVPSRFEDLVKLPGVGRKTANVVLSVGFDIPAFAVDTHVDRIAKRLGFAKPNDSVLVVEKKVTKSINKNLWNKVHHQFIFFGRYFCKAKNPTCHQCELVDMCKEKNKCI